MTAGHGGGEVFAMDGFEDGFAMALLDPLSLKLRSDFDAVISV
jgi:hypothetical protein